RVHYKLGKHYQALDTCAQWDLLSSTNDWGNAKSRSCCQGATVILNLTVSNHQCMFHVVDIHSAVANQAKGLPLLAFVILLVCNGENQVRQCALHLLTL